MKSVVSVNIGIPGLSDAYDFDSGGSLSDYEIILFNPELPDYSRHRFADGTSAIDRVSGRKAVTHLEHWNRELRNALQDGKTIFFMLAEKTHDSYITGIASSTAKMTNYKCETLCNYEAVPFSLDIANSRGLKFVVRDNRYRPIFETLKEYIAYEALLDGETVAPIVTTVSGGKALGATYVLEDAPGCFVVLPYFDFSDLIEEDDDGNGVWTREGLGVGTKLIKNLKDIDKFLNSKSGKTPTPDWAESTTKSEFMVELENKVADLDTKLSELMIEKDATLAAIADAELPRDLLFETGKPLEAAVEAFLQSVGYVVSNFRDGALEIDHLIISPEGKRFVGEAEGKDTAAINITKFRQLESNINEDFERDDVTEHAVGILFGNGYRYKNPSERPEQFTEKCITNAKRLDTVLVRTSDLYPIAVYLQDHPSDEEFKRQCRQAIESATGAIAQLPERP